jgi:ubiquinone/menaquinone biosynthesis C-methylase UbiE
VIVTHDLRNATQFRHRGYRKPIEEQGAVPSSDVILQAFSELAPGYEESMDRELRKFLGLGYAAFVAGLLEVAAVKSGESVLDVATGTALIPRQLAQKIERPGEIVGLDITPAMLRQAQTALDRDSSAAAVRLVCASGLALPFAPSSFDVILCGFGAHHMEMPTMLSEMRRVLKGSGRLALAAVGVPPFLRSFWARALVHVVLKLAGLLQQGARIQAEVAAFSNVHTAAEWQAALSHAGFDSFNVAKARARHRWYPRALTITAGTGGAKHS